MPARYFLATSPVAVSELLGVAEIGADAATIGPRYNIAPGQRVPVVRGVEGLRGDDTRNDDRIALGSSPARPLARTPAYMSLARWGLIPGWSASDDIGVTVSCLSLESIGQRPAGRDAFARRRCLVPADGFFEWKATGHGRRQPMCVRVRSGVAAGPVPFAMAGVWDRWYPRGEDQPGPVVETFAIITVPANEALREFAERMPMILRPEEYAAWLALSEASGDGARAPGRPCDPDLLEVYPVSAMVSSPRNDSPRCIEPWDEAAFGPLSFS
ncbi:MAG: SOS response-associated peptidase [Phycisphaeraceae bacterium]|nr:MAG: SOS response-associated peptidase [Phycisphaeraceae bacterium]